MTTTGPSARPCWRCGKPGPPPGGPCAYCGALERRARARPESAGTFDGPVQRVIVAYTLMLIASLVYGASMSFGFREAEMSPAVAQRYLRGMLAFELVDTVLVVVAVASVGMRWRRPATMPAPVAWAAGLSAVTVALAMNVGYHEVLRRIIGAPAQPDELLAAAGVSPLLLVVYCVQPAIVEELFFRGLVLDTLQEGLGRKGQAIAISSVMFGLAHLGVPLSIPSLALVGVPLAWARLASGGLALPMVMHFLHNLAVLVLNAP